MRKLAAALLVGLILTVSATSSFALSAGADAPDFALKNLQGQTVRLSDYKGRYVLLKLGSSQCPSCVEQVETIQDIGEFLKENGVVFLDIYLRDSQEMIEEAVKGEKFPMTTEILVGDLDVYKAYRVYLIPRVLLIDPDRKVVRDGSMWSASEIKRSLEGQTGMQKQH